MKIRSWARLGMAVGVTFALVGCSDSKECATSLGESLDKTSEE